MNGAASGFALLLVILSLFAAGCTTGGNGPSAGDGRMTVGVTILPLADFVEEIGGDRVGVIVMVPPGASPATYEPTIDQLMEIADARLYVKTGTPLPFETVYLGRLVAANPDMTMINASEGLAIVGNDPHTWTSPNYAMQMIDTVTAGLSQADPDHAPEYRQNALEYRQRLEALDTEIRTTLAAGNTTAFIVYHPAWGYFARDYGLTQIAIEEEGKEPGALRIRQIIDFAREEHITVIFANPQFSTRSAEMIARQINGTVVAADPLGVPYIENLRSFAGMIAGGG
jgi:zinc transport system substrate-binding protein